MRSESGAALSVQAIRSTVATVRANIVLLRKVLGLEQAASLVVGQAALAAYMLVPLGCLLLAIVSKIV
jgi:hypothetical protein